MDAITFIAEQRIEQAIEEGLFDNLPGMGKPLILEDLSTLSPELRMAYTLLKNGGYIDKTPDPDTCVTTRDLLEQCPDEGCVYGKMQKLHVMMNRVRRAQGEGNVPEERDTPYARKLLERL